MSRRVTGSPHQPAPLPPSTGQSDSDQPVSFEEGLEDLGRIVERLEGGDLGLAEAIGAYEEGIALVRRLHRQLAACEQRVEILASGGGVGADVRTDPGHAAAGEEAAAPDKRTSARATAPGRTGRSRRLPGMDDPGAGV
ncbi:MAG: exodeoxyribonuclease VII small subunit [Planctomycetia bacterium]|nr:exodeoxyribonuclease VII small subunit [Planctomycetia bacterium]